MWKQRSIKSYSRVQNQRLQYIELQ